MRRPNHDRILAPTESYAGYAGIGDIGRKRTRQPPSARVPYRAGPEEYRAVPGEVDDCQVTIHTKRRSRFRRASPYPGPARSDRRTGRHPWSGRRWKTRRRSYVRPWSPDATALAGARLHADGAQRFRIPGTGSKVGGPLIESLFPDFASARARSKADTGRPAILSGLAGDGSWPKSAGVPSTFDGVPTGSATRHAAPAGNKRWLHGRFIGEDAPHFRRSRRPSR